PSRAQFWLDLPIDAMPWYLVGAPEERSGSEGRRGKRNHVLTAVHLLGEASFRSRAVRGDFDFVTLRMPAGSQNYPSNYGGVSGGGVRLLPLTMDPDKGISSIS